MKSGQGVVITSAQVKVVLCSAIGVWGQCGFLQPSTPPHEAYQSRQEARKGQPFRGFSAAPSVQTSAVPVPGMGHLRTMEVMRAQMMPAAAPGLKRKRENVVDGSNRTALSGPYSSSNSSTALVNPADWVAQELQSSAAQCSPDDALTFLKPTDAMVEAYTLEVVNALRTERVDELRRLYESGASLQCCNRFGESLLHMACRRGLAEIVRFLVREAGVSLLVRDDFGRTALHDAFWTPKPQFALVQFIVEEEPALLSVRDVRGFAPLHYVRKEHWREWCDFFAEHRHLLTKKDEPTTHKRQCCRSSPSPKE